MLSSDLKRFWVGGEKRKRKIEEIKKKLKITEGKKEK